MRINKSLILIAFVSVLMINLVSADKIINSGSTGLEIKYPAQYVFLDNQPAELEFHVYNTTSGMPITSGIGCYLHLYGRDGEHNYEGYDDTPSHIFDYSFDLNGANFTRDTIAYLVSCNSSTVGGWAEVGITVNQSGNDPSGAVKVFFFALFIFLCFELLGLLLWTILHFIEINIDARDLILNVSSYFALWAFYVLHLRFMGDVFISDFLLMLIEIGAVTTIIIPLIGFVVSYIKQNMKAGDHN